MIRRVVVIVGLGDGQRGISPSALCALHRLLTFYLAARVPVGVVDLGVLVLVVGLHIPIKAVLQAERVVLIFYPLELLLSGA